MEIKCNPRLGIHLTCGLQALGHRVTHSLRATHTDSSHIPLIMDFMASNILIPMPSRQVHRNNKFPCTTTTTTPTTKTRAPAHRPHTRTSHPTTRILTTTTTQLVMPAVKCSPHHTRHQYLHRRQRLPLLFTQSVQPLATCPLITMHAIFTSTRPSRATPLRP